ncbi:MAG: hypothetical protein ABH823_00395 [bacterium]
MVNALRFNGQPGSLLVPRFSGTRVIGGAEVNLEVVPAKREKKFFPPPCQRHLRHEFLVREVGTDLEHGWMGLAYVKDQTGGARLYLGEIDTARSGWGQLTGDQHVKKASLALIGFAVQHYFLLGGNEQENLALWTSPLPEPSLHDWLPRIGMRPITRCRTLWAYRGEDMLRVLTAIKTQDYSLLKPEA